MNWSLTALMMSSGALPFMSHTSSVTGDAAELVDPQADRPVNAIVATAAAVLMRRLVARARAPLRLTSIPLIPGTLLICNSGPGPDAGGRICGSAGGTAPQ